MQIKLGNSTVTGSDVFKLVWRGWFYGLLVIFLPFFAIAALVSLSGYGKWEVVLSVLMLPVVAAMQAVFAGGIVLLGLKVRPPINSGD